MVSKMPNVTWPEGSFMESVKGWQKSWFYIMEPRGTTWAAAPAFRSGAPLWLTSWPEKGQHWSSLDELTALQTRIQNMINKNIKLVNVIQVMLIHRILPCNTRLVICGSMIWPSTRPCCSSSTLCTTTSGRYSSRPTRHGRPRPRTAGMT